MTPVSAGLVSGLPLSGFNMRKQVCLDVEEDESRNKMRRESLLSTVIQKGIKGKVLRYIESEKVSHYFSNVVMFYMITHC